MPPGEAAPASVVEAAQKGLLPLLKAIPHGDLKHYNLSDEDMLEQAVPGTPFRINTITPDDILNYTQGTEVSEIISATPVWLVPVILENKVRALLTVDLMGAQWKAVAIGASGLAKEWDSIISGHPSSEGYRHTFVRIFQAKSDLVLLRHAERALGAGEQEIIPAESAKISLGLEEDKSYDSHDLMLRLQQAVLANLQM